MTHRYPTRERIVRLLILLTERPCTYTKKQLAASLFDKEENIKGDLEVLKNAGLEIDFDNRYRYYIEQGDQYKELRDLLHFTEGDRMMINQIIDQLDRNGKRGGILRKKLASLYDYKKLGHEYLRRPYLAKVDALLDAQKNKKQVILKNYKSSSGNRISNRLIEPFHLLSEADTLQAYDVDKRMLKHFRISRFDKIEVLEDNWEFENFHYIQQTDPFRIVDDKQVKVCLRIKIGARNELIERFPMTKGCIEEEGEGIYDFQCNVNHRFIGLTNFILGFHHQLVDIVFPESLRDHLNEQVEKMKF